MSGAEGRLLFNKRLFEGLNLEVISGSKEIIPGVRVFLTPGHTPGGQSVEVNTTAGKAVICSLCGTSTNFKPTEVMKAKGWEVIPPLLHHDVRQAYDSLLRIKQRADIIITVHDPVYIGRERIP